MTFSRLVVGAGCHLELFLGHLHFYCSPIIRFEVGPSTDNASQRSAANGPTKDEGFSRILSTIANRVGMVDPKIMMMIPSWEC